MLYIDVQRGGPCVHLPHLGGWGAGGRDGDGVAAAVVVEECVRCVSASTEPSGSSSCVLMLGLPPRAANKNALPPPPPPSPSRCSDSDSTGEVVLDATTIPSIKSFSRRVAESSRPRGAPPMSCSAVHTAAPNPRWAGRREGEGGEAGCGGGEGEFVSGSLLHATASRIELRVHAQAGWWRWWWWWWWGQQARVCSVCTSIVPRLTRGESSPPTNPYMSYSATGTKGVRGDGVRRGGTGRSSSSSSSSSKSIKSPNIAPSSFLLPPFSPTALSLECRCSEYYCSSARGFVSAIPPEKTVPSSDTLGRVKGLPQNAKKSVSWRRIKTVSCSVQ